MTPISLFRATLDVSDEEDGRVNNFRFGSIDALPDLVGTGSHKLAAGQPRPSMSHQTENETFLAMKFLGMPSNTSLYGARCFLR